MDNSWKVKKLEKDKLWIQSGVVKILLSDHEASQRKAKGRFGWTLKRCVSWAAKSVITSFISNDLIQGDNYEQGTYFPKANSLN